MTQTLQLLGAEYDAPAHLPQDIGLYPAKRDVALAGVKRAETARDAEATRVLKWELGFHDLVIAPADGVSPYHGATYDNYAEFYGLGPETVSYAIDRASETRDVILRLRYLEFVSLQSPKSGRARLEQQRELAQTYREYVDGTLASITPSDEFVGGDIDRALTGLGRVLARGGVVPAAELPEWAEWLLTLAERSREFPQKDDFWRKQQRHRWIADYLTHLTELPAATISDPVRARALELLEDAAEYYGSTPLNDNFAIVVAEADAAIRKHFGESGTHEKMIRSQVAALEGRAQFHQENGQHGLSIAHFQREALRLVMAHRQYFTTGDVARLSLAEQTALNQAVENGEFAVISAPISIPIEQMDFTGDTAANTVENLLRESIASIPHHAELEADAKRLSAESPLQASIGRTVIGRGKVVGEAKQGEENLALDVERHTVMLARLFGAAVAITVSSARDKVQLSEADLVAPFERLGLDQGTIEMITHGCERLIARDFVSAAHILVPRIEDTLRQRLRILGANTTTFKRGQGRTDDATLGTLLASSLPDGRTVRAWLGEDLWYYLDGVYASQTGLTLRHDFAHGLARPEHCSPDVLGIVLSLLYILAAHAD